MLEMCGKHLTDYMIKNDWSKALRFLQPIIAPQCTQTTRKLNL